MRELTGEADVVARGTAVILNNLRVLGIRKKQTYSPETLEKMRAKMREIRRATPSELCSSYPVGDKTPRRSRCAI